MSLALIVFAKAPVPGLAKTRLIPALGPEGAAALATRLLEHAVAQAAAAAAALGGSVELCVTPTTAHACFASLQSRHRLALSEQGDGDLGERMQRALSRALSPTFTRTSPRATGALLIGTDIPALDAAMLQAAAAALAHDDAVFVPALDGGYALVGLRRACPALFEGVAWSTAQVMQQTRERATRAGLRWTELPALADIDLPADLVHLPPGWAMEHAA